MQKIFIFLLLVNIITAFYFHIIPDDESSAHISLIHPEKIMLLSARVTCLRWNDLIGPVAQYVRAEIAGWDSEQTHITEISGGEIPVRWVHIPSSGTEHEMAEQIEQLEKLGISYLHIRENGSSPWHNMISLAILPAESDVMALITSLKSRGVGRVTHSEQSLEQFEFVIRNPTEQLTEQIQQLAGQFPDTRLDITECDRL